MPQLLDAAHIIQDKDEKLGHPIVPNGIPLSKVHHAAFDAQLIGIDPDYRLYVSRRLLMQTDGAMLDALKGLNGIAILLPKRAKDRPDRDRLAVRFDLFKGRLETCDGVRTLWERRWRLPDRFAADRGWTVAGVVLTPPSAPPRVGNRLPGVSAPFASTAHPQIGVVIVWSVTSWSEAGDPRSASRATSRAPAPPGPGRPSVISDQSGVVSEAPTQPMGLSDPIGPT